MSVEASPRVTMESSTGVVVEFDIFVNDTVRCICQCYIAVV